jgi:hypothetical protein
MLTVSSKLFESDPMPLTYRLARKYKRAGLAAVLYHDKDVGKGFQKAYAEFRSIFEEKTGINWDQRLEKLKQEEGNYVYMPPTGGKPVGTLPFRSYGRKKSDQKLEQKSNIVAPLSKGAGSGDSQMMDPDLMDDTDSGDDAS